MDGTPTGDSSPGGDYAINIFVDGPTKEANSFERHQPFAAAVSQSIGNTGYLHGPDDVDRIAFYAQAGEVISVVASVDRAVTSTIAIAGVGDAQSANAAGELVVLQSVPITSDGTYEIEISADDLAYFEITIFRNADLERSIGDSSNATPLSIDSSRITFGMDRFAVIGESETGFEMIHSNDSSNFIDITQNGNPVAVGEDLEALAETTIGNAAFPAGTITIGDNGGILSGEANLIFQNLPMSFGSSLFEFALLPYWDDLSIPLDNIYIGETTVGGIPTLIVQWEQSPHFDLLSNDPPGDVTFQVQVFESGPVLARYAYEDVVLENPSYDFGATSTIGYQHADGRFVEFSFNQPVLSNGDIIDLVIDPDVDTYTIDLSAKTGNRIDIALANHDGQDLTGELLELLDENGAVLATGTPNSSNPSNFDLGILDFVVPAVGSGIFSIRFTSTKDGQYGIVVSDSMKLDVEPNNNGDSLRTLSPGTDRALGFLDGIDTEDRLTVDIAAGQLIHLSTLTPFFDAAANPLVDLDPALTLYDSDGTTVVASDDNSLGGREAELTFASDTGGTYFVAISAVSGAGEYLLTSAMQSVDYGDAPVSFPTLFADDGARHVTVGPRLGSLRDADLDGQPTAAADGDDTDAPTNDEDGLIAQDYAVGQFDAFFTVLVEDAADALLNVWIDFDGDGAWSAPEHLVRDARAVDGSNRVFFDVPSNVHVGQIAARIRISTQPGLGPTGPAPDGEVEDHLLRILPLPEFTIDDVSVTEGDSELKLVEFTVVRSHNLTSASVSFTTADGSALAAEDYSAISGTLNFVEGGQVTQLISVAINGDTEIEFDEMFSVHLGSPVDATIDDGVGIGTVLNDDATSITRVRVGSTQWDSTFVNFVDPTLQLGFPIVHGVGQLDPAPWNNVDRIYVQFDSDVTIGPTDVNLYGVNNQDYTSLITNVSFDATDLIATIELSSALAVDKYLLRIRDSVSDLNGDAIDGEWFTSVSTESGDGEFGEDFLYRFNVLPGDADGNGGVLGPDISLARNLRFELPGTPNYDDRVDFDGDGIIAGTDIQWARDNRFVLLPEGEPNAPAALIFQPDSNENRFAELRYRAKRDAALESLYGSDEIDES